MCLCASTEEVLTRAVARVESQENVLIRLCCSDRRMFSGLSVFIIAELLHPTLKCFVATPSIPFCALPISGNREALFAFFI